MKRSVCLGARLFPIGFITRHSSKRVLRYRIAQYLVFPPDCTAGVSMSSFQAWFDGCRIASCRNLGLAIVQLHHAHRTCGPTAYMPSPVFRVMSMLLSTFGFPLRVSSCPRGLTLSLSCVAQGFHMHRRGAPMRPNCRFLKPDIRLPPLTNVVARIVPSTV